MERERMVNMPVCDCKKGTIKKNDNLSSLKPTKIDKDEICVYCGHYAHWKRITEKEFQLCEYQGQS